MSLDKGGRKQEELRVNYPRGEEYLLKGGVTINI